MTVKMAASDLWVCDGRTGGGAYIQSLHPITTAHALVVKQKNKMAAHLSDMFWIYGCTVGGTGEAAAIFVYSLWLIEMHYGNHTEVCASILFILFYCKDFISE